MSQSKHYHENYCQTSDYAVKKTEGSLDTISGIAIPFPDKERNNAKSY